MVQMGEICTTQRTVRQPPQLGSKKNKHSKQPTGGVFGFSSSDITYKYENKFFSIAAKVSY